MNKYTVKDLDVDNKKVFVRCDFNVPLDANQNITDLTRIKGALPTINYLLEHNAKVILVSELALAENSSNDEIERLVDNKIDMSYKEYRVPTEANIDLKQSAVNKFIPFDGTTNV